MVVVDSMWRIFVNTFIIYNFVSSGSMYQCVGEVLDNGHFPVAYINHRVDDSAFAFRLCTTFLSYLSPFTYRK